MLCLFLIRSFIIHRLYIPNQFRTLGNELIFSWGFKFSADVLTERFQELDLFWVGIIFLFYFLLFLFELLLESFQYCYEVLLDETFTLSDLRYQFLHLKLYLIPIFPKTINFLIEACQLIENFILVILVYSFQVRQFMTPMLQISLRVPWARTSRNRNI